MGEHIRRPASRLLEYAGHGAALFVVISPIWFCWARAGVVASLWLDEVLYFNFQSDDALRAANLGRPGSRLAPLFGGYFGCDLQRWCQAILGRLGVRTLDRPEVAFRALSCFSVMLIGLVIYGRNIRWRRSRIDSALFALVATSSPLLLFYACEGRVFAPAALFLVVYFVLLEELVRSQKPSGLAIAAATVCGVLAAHAVIWTMPLFAVIAFAGVFFLRAELEPNGRWRALATPVAVPLIVGGIESVYALASGGRGSRFPLYDRQAFWSLVTRTLEGPFSGSVDQRAVAGRIAWLPSVPETVCLGVLTWLAVRSFRRSESRRVIVLLLALSVCLAIAAFAGASVVPAHDANPVSVPVIVLAIAWGATLRSAGRAAGRFLVGVAAAGLGFAVALGWAVGFLVVPRYLVPILALLLASLAIGRGSIHRVAILVLLAVELAFLPATVSGILAKGNGRQIAHAIETSETNSSTAIVLQHALRGGYPDPLHSFVLDFYLNQCHPDRRPFELLELPKLEDVAGFHQSSRYLAGGRDLVEAYSDSREEPWVARLRAMSSRRIVFVFPKPETWEEARQAREFRAALADTGYVPSGSCEDFRGYPPTRLCRYGRPGGAGRKPAPS